MRANLAVTDLHRAYLAAGADAVDGWLRLLSEEYNQPIAALRAMLDAKDLAAEIAGLIVRHAKRIAQQHVQDTTEPDDLLPTSSAVLRVTWRYYRKYKAEHDEKVNAKARAQLAALFNAQEQQSKQAHKGHSAPPESTEG